MKFSCLILVCSLLLFSCQHPKPKENTNKAKQPSSSKDNVVEQLSNSKAKEDAVSLSDISVDSLTHRFLKNLEKGKDLSLFFAKEWIFVYHEDNRCEGSTDGKINHLNQSDIDKTIKLTVKNDGEGWACEKTPPKTFELNFNLKQTVKSWDRFQIPNYVQKQKSIVYIIGKGESDYLKLYYDENHLIFKLQYGSEDPG
ncbi:MAG: hypothetical protein ABIP95_10865 [Pelobium sp.]